MTNEQTSINTASVVCDGLATILLSDPDRNNDGSLCWSVEVKDYNGDLVQVFHVTADNIDIVNL
jgi:hypothetical protein